MINTRPIWLAEDIANRSPGFWDWLRAWAYRLVRERGDSFEGSYELFHHAYDDLSKVCYKKAEMRPFVPRSRQEFWRLVSSTHTTLVSIEDSELRIQRMGPKNVQLLWHYYLQTECEKKSVVIDNASTKNDTMSFSADFNDFARDFLQKYFQNVIYRKKPSALGKALYKRLFNTQNGPVLLSGLSAEQIRKFRNIPFCDLNVKNPLLRNFEIPLFQLFCKEKGEQHFSNSAKSENSRRYCTQMHFDNEVNQETVDVHSLENCPVQEVKVDVFYVEMPSKIGTYDFAQDVYLLLLNAYERNSYKWVSASYIANQLGVDLEDFCKWANSVDWLVGYFSKLTQYYGLNDLLETQELKMSENTNQVTDDKEKSTPDIGTDGFLEVVLEFFKTEGFTWRTIDAFCEAKPEYAAKKQQIEEWAAGAPILIRRKSSKNGSFYYALYQPKEKEKEPDSTEVKSADNATKTTTSKPTKVDENVAEKNNKGNSLILPIDIAVYSMLHMAAQSLVVILNKYANRLATNHEEAFSHLTKAQKSLMSGLSLLQKSTRMNKCRLPDIDEV